MLHRRIGLCAAPSPHHRPLVAAATTAAAIVQAVLADTESPWLDTEGGARPDMEDEDAYIRCNIT